MKICKPDIHVDPNSSIVNLEVRGKQLQKIFIVSTSSLSLRSEIYGWSFVEDPNLFVRGKPIGFTPSVHTNYSPKTVLEALADGWHLLSRPVREEAGYVWWLHRTD